MESLVLGNIFNAGSFKSYVIKNGSKVDSNSYRLKNPAKMELMMPFLISLKQATSEEKKKLTTVIIKNRVYFIKRKFSLTKSQKRKQVKIVTKTEEKTKKRLGIEKDIFIPAQVVLKMFGEDKIIKHNINYVLKRDGEYVVPLLYVIQKMRGGAKAKLQAGIPKEAVEHLVFNFPYLIDDFNNEASK